LIPTDFYLSLTLSFCFHVIYFIARIQQQRDEREERGSQDIVQKERLLWESLEEDDDDDLLLALAISASADEYSSPVSHASSQPMSEAEMAALQRANVLE
jgi:hypothetical protein